MRLLYQCPIALFLYWLLDLRAEMLLQRIVYDEKLTLHSSFLNALARKLCAHTRTYSHHEGCDDHYASLCTLPFSSMQFHRGCWFKYHTSTLLSAIQAEKKIEGASMAHSIVKFQFASRTTDALKCLSRFFPYWKFPARNNIIDIDNSIHMAHKNEVCTSFSYSFVNFHSWNFWVIQIRTIWYKFNLVAYINFKGFIMHHVKRMFVGEMQMEIVTTSNESYF